MIRKNNKHEKILSTDLQKMDELRHKNIFAIRWHLLTLGWWLIAFIWFLTQWKNALQFQEMHLFLKITILSFSISIFCVMTSSIFIPMYDLKLISFNRKNIKGLQIKINDKSVNQHDIDTYNHLAKFGLGQETVSYVWDIVRIILCVSVLIGIVSLMTYYFTIMF